MVAHTYNPSTWEAFWECQEERLAPPRLACPVYFNNLLSNVGEVRHMWPIEGALLRLGVFKLSQVTQMESTRIGVQIFLGSASDPPNFGFCVLLHQARRAGQLWRWFLALEVPRGTCHPHWSNASLSVAGCTRGIWL